jgi:hypothetical protein
MQDIMSFNQKETRQDIWAKYDPKKAIEGIQKSKGALKGVDRDRLQREIREQADRTAQAGLPNVCPI